MKIFKTVRNLLLLIILILIFYLITYSITKYTGFIVSDFSNEFANCLSEKNIEMYLDNNYMDNLDFLNTIQYIDNIRIIDCSLNKSLCLEKGIKEYPSWLINNKKLEGNINLYELSDFSGCDI